MKPPPVYFYFFNFLTNIATRYICKKKVASRPSAFLYILVIVHKNTSLKSLTSLKYRTSLKSIKSLTRLKIFKYLNKILGQSSSWTLLDQFVHNFFTSEHLQVSVDDKFILTSRLFCVSSVFCVFTSWSYHRRRTAKEPAFARGKAKKF